MLENISYIEKGKKHLYFDVFQKLFLFYSLVFLETYFFLFQSCFQVSEQKMATLEVEKKHLEFMNEMKVYDDSEGGNAGNVS